jgi:hypothetical protein
MREGARIAVSDCVRDANVEFISSHLWCCIAHRELTAEIAPAVACNRNGVQRRSANRQCASLSVHVSIIVRI